MSGKRYNKNRRKVTVYYYWHNEEQVDTLSSKFVPLAKCGRMEVYMSINECLRQAVPYDDGVICLRTIEENDKKGYFALIGEVGDILKDTLWTNALHATDLVTFILEDKETHSVAGIGEMKERGSGCVEIGYEISEKWKGRGYGARILSGLLHIAADMVSSTADSPYRDIKFIARVHEKNIRSLHIIEKYGGVKCGEEPSQYEELLSRGEKSFVEKHADLIDHSHILVYEFRWDR